MYKILLCWSIFFIFINTTIFSQAGFLNAYDYNRTAASGFREVLNDNDTLVCLGIIRDTVSPHLQGVVFSKIDACGNIILTREYYDTTRYFFIDFRKNLIKTKDKGYAFVGSVGGGIFFMKLDYNGNQISYRTYADSTFRTYRANYIVELEDGYGIIGQVQRQNYTIAIYAIKVNEEGEFMWQMIYGDAESCVGLGSIDQLSPSKVAIGGGMSVYCPPGTSIVSSELSRIEIFTIDFDAEGAVDSEWIYPEDSKYTGGRGLLKTPDGGWVYCGTYVDSVYFWGSTSTLFTKGFVTKLDKDMSVVWSKTFGEPTSNSNGFYDLLATEDGDYVAVGQFVRGNGYEVDLPVRIEAWMLKLSSDGDSLWSRLDTIYSDPNFGVNQSWYNLTGLSDGSLVTAGTLFKYGDDPQNQACLMRVNKNGELGEEDCQLINAIQPTIDLKESIRITPNPTTDKISMDLKDKYDIRIINVTGQVIQSHFSKKGKITLSLFNLTKGIYFIHIYNASGQMIEKVVKK